MNDKLNLYKKISIIVLIVLYLIFASYICIFILKENKFGITEFGDKSYIIIKNNDIVNYKKGSLVIVENKNISELNNNDEIFYYNSNDKNEIYISNGIIEKVSLDTEPQYVILKETKGNWKDEAVIGTIEKTYNGLGYILNVFTNDFCFLVLIIIPIISLILYEVYNILRYFGINPLKESKN